MSKTTFNKLKVDLQLGLTPKFIEIDRLDLNLKKLIIGAKNDEKQEKIKKYKEILQSHGITKLSNLGSLTLQGNVVPESGLISVKSGVKTSDLLQENAVLFQSSYSGVIEADDTVKLNKIGGHAHLLKSTQRPRLSFRIDPKSRIRSTAQVSDAPLEIYEHESYLIAQHITLQDNTNYIISQPLKHIVIICEKLTIGKNVTFTWERPTKPNPVAHPRQSAPAAAPTSTRSEGVDGTDGRPGLKGNRGFDGDDAPEIELWALEVSGQPIIDLSGQDGGQGGKGQDGMPGGKGGKGRPASTRGRLGLGCENYPGAGGNGGNGGAAGDGGDGGNGGDGGRFSFYAPHSFIKEYKSGFYASVTGGNGGVGGIPGTPGHGGAGGEVGRTAENLVFTCAPRAGVTAGKPGTQGSAGAQGKKGINGDFYEDGLFLQEIEKDEFFEIVASTDPIIESVVPSQVICGDQVTVRGKHFSENDVVYVDGQKANTISYSDVRMQFTVPFVKGGNRVVEVKRGDANNTTSNKGGIYVKPHIEESAETRVKPGEIVRLTGSGFEENAIVYVNDQEMSAITYVNPREIEFRIIRPNQIEENAYGEELEVKILLSDGTPSNIINLTLDTYQMFVFGDSVQWGQGLIEHEKFHSIVAEDVKTANSGIGFYKEVYARSGAIIGFNNSGSSSVAHGEVPSSYPTVLQQVDAVTGPSEHVDLILLDGGYNDVGIDNVLNPIGPDLGFLCEKYFYYDMKILLEKVTQKFPEAKIIVTGYYQPISNKSDRSYIYSLLTAVGITLGPANLVGAGLISMAVYNQIVKRCKQVNDLSKTYLQRAVNDVNQSPNGNNRIFFAAPNFGEENAVFASDPYIYGVNLDLTAQDAAIRGERAIACELAGKKGTDLIRCKLASVGHPNAKGARAYAEAIREFL